MVAAEVEVAHAVVDNQRYTCMPSSALIVSAFRLMLHYDRRERH